MKVLDTVGVIEELCKAKSCYGIYFNFRGSEAIYYDKNGPDFDGFYAEIRKAIPIMFSKCDEKHLKDEFTQAFVDSEGWVIFDKFPVEDQEAVMKFNFDQIVGDDGPTRLNDYNGPLSVYAITFGPDGTLDENT